MGILSPIQKQFIKRPDSAKNQIVYKWPDDTIRMHTQLTVEPDEQALFVKEGKVVGTLSEGLHTIDGANIPFVGGLLALGTGGNYFVSELYFVSIREFVNQLFGGPVDNVTDPQTELAVGLRCYGEYSIKVISPQNLILNLVGTTNISSMGEINAWVSSQLLKVVREIVVSHVVSNDDKRWDVLGIAAHNEDLESESVTHTNELLTSYGLSITRLGNINVSLDDADAATLKQLKRDTAYGQNMPAADAALKLGAAKGFEQGGGNAGLLAAGFGLGGAAAGSAVQSVILGSCPSCNAAIPAGAKFCPNCGKELS